MHQPIEHPQRPAAGFCAPAEASAGPFDAPSGAERFLAHHAAAAAAMREAREHLIDAMRAIDSSDRHVLSHFLAVSRLLSEAGDIARPISDFGLAAAARGRWPVAIEALAYAARVDERIGDGSLAADARRSRDVADALAAAARAVGRPTSPPSRPPVHRQVGLLVTTLDGATAALLEGWAEFADADAPSLRVYATQSWVAPPAAPAFDERTDPRLAAPAPPPSAALVARLRERGVEVWAAPEAADWSQRFRLINERLVRDAIGALYVDASLADATAWMAAGTRGIARQYGMLRQGRSIGSALDGVLDLDDAMHRGERRPAVDPGLPIESLFQGVGPPPAVAAARAGLGVPASATLVVSCCRDPSRSPSPAFVRAVARVLAENRDAVYLIVGPGDFDAARAIFRDAGVHRRVGFAGDRPDRAAIVAAADVYLAAPGDSDRDSLLLAMRCGKPVAVLAGPDDSAGLARLVGERHATTGNVQSLSDRLGELLTSPVLRQEAGAELAERAASQLSIEQTIRRWTAHCRAALGLPLREAATSATVLGRVA